MLEAVHDEGDLLGCDGIEAHFLWEVLTDKSVHVLSGTTTVMTTLRGLVAAVSMLVGGIGVMTSCWSA
jgi:hypothetical protein